MSGTQTPKYIDSGILQNCPVLRNLLYYLYYAGLLLVPAEGFGRGFFCPSGKKRPYYALSAHLWFLVVTLVTFSSNLSNFVGNLKKKLNKKSKKKQTILKSKKIQKFRKI